MKSLQEHLKDADPVAQEPPLSLEHVLQMRRAIWTSRRTVRSRHVRTHRAAWTITAAAVTVAVAAGVSRWEHTRTGGAAPAGEAAATAAPRQLQFATPGGTRVIWVFNPDFQP